jgi:hypothetical protein
MENAATKALVVSALPSGSLLCTYLDLPLLQQALASAPANAPAVLGTPSQLNAVALTALEGTAQQYVAAPAATVLVVAPASSSPTPAQPVMATSERLEPASQLLANVTAKETAARRKHCDKPNELPVTFSRVPCNKFGLRIRREIVKRLRCSSYTRRGVRVSFKIVLECEREEYLELFGSISKPWGAGFKFFLKGMEGESLIYALWHCRPSQYYICSVFFFFFFFFFFFVFFFFFFFLFCVCC